MHLQPQVCPGAHGGPTPPPALLDQRCELCPGAQTPPTPPLTLLDLVILMGLEENSAALAAAGARSPAVMGHLHGEKCA